jgi:hypothetical protein
MGASQGPAGAPAKQYLTADQILAAEDIATDDIEVPEWGGTVRVKGLTVHDLNEANRLATVAGEVDAEKITCMVLVFGCVEPRFTPDQVGLIAQKSAAVVNRLGGAIFRLSGIGDTTPQALEARFRQGAS